MSAAPADFDLRQLPAAFFDDPYPTYRQLHELGGVIELPDGGVLLTGYDALRTVYRDAKRFSSNKERQFGPVFGAESPLYVHHTTSLVFNDPPLHTIVRRAIGNALAEKTLIALGPALETLVTRLLDQAERQGTFDLIADYAAAIPVEIIGNLLRVPSTEREPLRRWSLAILGALEVNLTPAQQLAGNQAVTEFVAYLDQLVEQRAAALQADDDDIVARLLRYSANHPTFTRNQLYHQCIFLLNAGHETTTNLIGNGVVLLHQHPHACVSLAQQPERIDSAVEEILRMESPNQLGNRTVTEDVEIAGVRIPAGTVLTLCIGAANRDPAKFPAADSFWMDRAPNAHLAFGAGIHTCAGLNVARLEARIAIVRLLQRFSRLEFVEPPQRAQRARFRGFSRARVRVA